MLFPNSQNIVTKNCFFLSAPVVANQEVEWQISNIGASSIRKIGGKIALVTGPPQGSPRRVISQMRMLALVV